MKIEDLTLTEAIIALKWGFVNLGREIKSLLFLLGYKIIFLFSKPKYKIYQRVWIWDECFMIMGIKRDWLFCHYVYELLGCNVDVSEGIIDFYKDK